MKPRTVVFTIEAETDLPLRDLRDCTGVVLADGLEQISVKQVQVNVITATKPRARTTRAAKKGAKR